MAKVVFSVHDQIVELNYPALLQEKIDFLFGPQPSEQIAKPPGHVLTINDVAGNRFRIFNEAGRSLGDQLSADDLLDVLLEEVVRSLVDDLDTAIALHSASVGSGSASVLIAGPSGAGKTSLTGWLVAKGFDFLSDELVVVPLGERTTLTFRRPLLAKPGADELIGLLTQTGRGRVLQTAANTVISLSDSVTQPSQMRQAGLIIFPNFIAGSHLEFSAVSPAMAATKLMECNLNARNLAEHGFRALSVFARHVPAVTLTYGEFKQLESVGDLFVKFVLENAVGVAGLQNFISAFAGTRSAIPERLNLSAPLKSRHPIPEATPFKAPKKITIGMATYDDYDGVYFSLQAIRLYHPEILDDTEFLLIDNHPSGPCGHPLKDLEGAIPNYRYIPKSDVTGTAIRDCIFQEASGEIVLCMDCHVFVVPGALKRLIDYFDAHPETRDLLQGPLIQDDLMKISTHFKPDWRAGMYGFFSTSAAGADPDNPPFEITMQGLALFACRRAVWPGFNPDFRGFGGEEGYIHEKFRQQGGRVFCLPFLRWMHRFKRPMGVPYPIRWEDRVRNYLIGFRELGWDTTSMVKHFETVIDKGGVRRVVAQLAEEKDPYAEDLAQSVKNVGDNAKSKPVSELSILKKDDAFGSVWEGPALVQQRHLLRRVADIAESNNIALYLYWGTLLGHIREGGILPWDYDVDLAIFDLACERYNAFCAAIEADGLQVFRMSAGDDIWIKICDPTSPIQSHNNPWTWPFVDLFLYSTEPVAREGGWPTQKIPRKMILPGRIITFEGVRCREPEQPLAVLDSHYPDWRVLETSSSWNHRWEKRIPAVFSRAISVDQHGRKIG